NAFCRRSPGSSISSALRGAAPGRRVGAGGLRDLAVRTLLVRRAGFDLDHRGTRPAPPADDRLDLLVEHLWLLDRELATDRVVVEGARPPRRRDLEAGEVAARRAPVPGAQVRRRVHGRIVVATTRPRFRRAGPTAQRAKGSWGASGLWSAARRARGS